MRPLLLIVYREAQAGIEPAYRRFADGRVTSSPLRRNYPSFFFGQIAADPKTTTPTTATSHTENAAPTTATAPLTIKAFDLQSDLLSSCETILSVAIV